LVVTKTENRSLIDFQIVNKDKQILKIVLENENLVQQYKTLILTNKPLKYFTNNLFLFSFPKQNHESNYLSWYFVSAQKLD